MADHPGDAGPVPERVTACPRCRRLERMLLVATAYLAPSNWYESPETLKLLDRIKRHLPARLQDILNRHLAPRIE